MWRRHARRFEERSQARCAASRNVFTQRLQAFSSLQIVLAGGPVPQLEIDVFLDIRMDNLVKDGGDRVIADQA